jgi:hypothetical protein
MKGKLFFLVCSIFLLSGCTLNYKISIDKNDIVNENISLTETIKMLGTYTLNVEQYVQDSLDIFKEDEKYFSYSLYTDNDANNYYGIANRKYLDLENFKNNSIIVSEMFNEVTVDKNNGVITFEMNPKDSFEYFKEDTQNIALIDEVNIKIYVPYEVVSSNKDKVEDNVYIWNIKKGENLQKVYIKFDTNKKLRTPIPKNVLIISGMVIFSLGLVLSIYIKYKRNGR